MSESSVSHSYVCKRCEQTWEDATADATASGSDPTSCPHCGSTELTAFDPRAAPFPHQPNPELLHLQYLTPQAPPNPGAMVRMGPYMPLPKPSGSPARWAEDPAGRNQWRWWNGSTWTDYVGNDGVTTTDPLD